MDMLCLLLLVLFILLAGVLFYFRMPIWIWDISALIYLVITFPLYPFILWVLVGIILIGLLSVFNFSHLRQKLISKPAYLFAKKQLPKMSSSEKLAIEAGTVSWDRDLFSGMPAYQTLFDYQPASMSQEEIDFLNGPTEILCQMSDPWKMWHEDLVLPEDMERYIKENGFLGMKIHKKYGGKEFSTMATWAVNLKIFGQTGPASTIINIASSIGSAQLLQDFGTEAQKNYFLPRLANGTDISCFALTSPIAGSDATSIEDYGVVCKGEIDGNEVIGIKLNFNKRYITLAPIATLIGLAFRLYDPEKLIGDKENIGISIALVPADLPGVKIGRRHYPVGVPFPNGPLSGKDVFIPLDNLLGGTEMAGKGWKMLASALATGRATSLPTNGTVLCKNALYFSSCYAAIRKQFGMNIGSFEGVQEKLAEIAAFTYITDATKLFTFAQLHAGEKPAITAAISKYHTTEFGRKCAMNAMDILGGKGIMVGPRNPMAALFSSSPVGITVEGANIMTRNLIIFGQGAIRCHPYLMKEMEILANEDFDQFDEILIKHMNYIISNHVRSFWFGISNGFFTRVPAKSKLVKKRLKQFTRISSAFALVSDISLLYLGGKLKRMESLSGRFSDVFSMLFMGTAVIKHFHDQNYPDDLLPIIDWATLYILNQAETALEEILQNIPNKLLSTWLYIFLFPVGRRCKKPTVKLSHTIAKAVQKSKDIRRKLAEGLYFTPSKFNLIKDFDNALDSSLATADLNDKIMRLKNENKINGYNYIENVNQARIMNFITEDEKEKLLQAYETIMRVINVDDFSLQELKEQK